MGRLYYSVVLLPTVDASPAQSVAIQHPLVNGLYSFAPSATSAGSVPDALLSGLQRGVTGTFIYPSHFPCSFSSISFYFHLPLSSFSISIVHEEVRACVRGGVV